MLGPSVILLDVPHLNLSQVVAEDHQGSDFVLLTHITGLAQASFAAGEKWSEEFSFTTKKGYAEKWGLHAQKPCRKRAVVGKGTGQVS